MLTSPTLKQHSSRPLNISFARFSSCIYAVFLLLLANDITASGEPQLEVPEVRNWEIGTVCLGLLCCFRDGLSAMGILYQIMKDGME